MINAGKIYPDDWMVTYQKAGSNQKWDLKTEYLNYVVVLTREGNKRRLNLRIV